MLYVVPTVYLWSRASKWWQAETHPTASESVQQSQQESTADVQHMWERTWLLLQFNHQQFSTWQFKELISVVYAQCCVTAFLWCYSNTDLRLCSITAVVMLAGPKSSPSCGAQSRAGHSRTEQPSLVEILQDLRLSDKEELFLMQLPDCMPSRVSQRKIDPTFESSADRPARKEGKSGDKRPAPMQTQVS